jgi:hypothetical protein
MAPGFYANRLFVKNGFVALHNIMEGITLEFKIS